MTGPGVVLITPEPLSERMAGPAIRMLELGRALAADPRIGAVTVASLAGATRSDDSVDVRGGLDQAGLRTLVSRAGSVVVQGDVLSLQPWLAQTDVPLVVDVYDPFHLEQLEQARSLGETRRRTVVRNCVRALNVQLSRADLVLCASARQRALWTGHLAALGRVNPPVYDAAADLSSLIRVVPFGTPSRPPAPRDRAALSGVLPGLADDEVVLVWGGGLYDWFDPQLLVRAVAELVERGLRTRLLFLGAGHPVPGIRTTADDVRALAAQLGVLDRGVHFSEGWVPYDERDRLLRAADVGVSTHHATVETEFSFRTRITDYLWCGLPVVCTSGDDLADRVAAAGAGLTVAAGDLAALVGALRTAVGDLGWRERAGAAAGSVGEELAWTAAVRPLADFCATPRRAPDLMLDEVDRMELGLWRPKSDPALTRLRALHREGGAGLVVRRFAGRLRGAKPATPRT